MARTPDDLGGRTARIRALIGRLRDGTKSSQAWNSVVRPGSIFRKGFTDSPRNRSYVIMNSVLYHLHPDHHRHWDSTPNRFRISRCAANACCERFGGRSVNRSAVSVQQRETHEP